MIQGETQIVPRSVRRQVPMIQDETEREDQKPKEVQISFSPYLKSRTDKAEVQTKMQTTNRDSRRIFEKGSREGDARRAGSTSERFSNKKAPPGMQTGRSLRTFLSRGVPADHEAQSQVKKKKKKKQLQESMRLEEASPKTKTVYRRIHNCGSFPHARDKESSAHVKGSNV